MSAQHESNYALEEYDNFLTPEECDQIIQLTKDQLIDSRVYASSDNDAVDNLVRNSRQAWLYDNDHALVNDISQTVSKSVNISPQHFEALQVVRYPTGGFYKPHYDACVGTKEFCQRANQQFNGQQRYITFLIYLNDDFEGGGTHFPKINYTVVPKKGKAVLFYSVDSTGKVLPGSLHGGEPVTKGEKWICNKWIHLPPEGHVPPSPQVQESFQPYMEQNTNSKKLKSVCESSFNGVGVL
jgi:prolyl 4-hydroxylase